MTDAHDAGSKKIKLLTKKTRDGEVYFRRTETQLQIEKISTFEKASILEMLGSDKRRDAADYLLDETLVYLFREARISGDDEFFNRIYTEVTISEKIIKNRLDKYEKAVRGIKRKKFDPAPSDFIGCLSFPIYESKIERFR